MEPKMSYKQWLFASLLLAMLTGVCGIITAMIGVLPSFAPAPATENKANVPVVVVVTPAAPAEPPPAVPVDYQEPETVNLRFNSETAVSNTISPQLEADVMAFLTAAYLAEMQAFWQANPLLTQPYYGGAAYTTISDNIYTLQNQGIWQVSLFDEQRSYVAAIRDVGNGRLAVDSCEYWAVEQYSLLDGSLLLSNPSLFLPQTLTIDTNQWQVIDFIFYDNAAFCTQ